MTGIYYPTLDLFYYYATSGLGVTTDDIKPINTYWGELQQKNSSDKNSIKFHEKGHFQGRFLRQNLGDSNCFHFDCSLDEKSISYTLDKIIDLRKRIEPLPPNSDIYLGRSWMIYGWVDINQNLSQIAKDVYKNLVGEDWEYQRGGTLLGATVVEAWRSYQEWDTPDVNSHALIILYPDQDSYKEASKSISDIWMRLLLYRHKIWNSYQKSRKNKENISNAFNEVVPVLENHSSYNLTQLGKSLEIIRKTLTIYSTNLHNISIQQQTLNTNLHNYNLAVEELISKADIIYKNNPAWNNNLKFLEKFAEIASVKYEKQLEKDYATLAPGLAVLTGLTETIRGLVEVQQAEIDRQQNITIAIAGLGLSASSAVAGIFATQVYQPEQKTSSVPELPSPFPKPESTLTTETSIPKNWRPGTERIAFEAGLLYSLIPFGIMGIVLIFLWVLRRCQKRS